MYLRLFSRPFPRARIPDGHVHLGAASDSSGSHAGTACQPCTDPHPQLWFLPVGFTALLSRFVTSSRSGWRSLSEGSWWPPWPCARTISSSPWIKSGAPEHAASDHLLLGVCFPFLSTVAGLAMGANYLRTPPVMPIGSPHLVAYTHPLRVHRVYDAGRLRQSRDRRAGYPGGDPRTETQEASGLPRNSTAS